MGQDSLGVLAAHGQQLVHREGGGAEDGLEGDGVDALSPQLTQGGQRGPEGGREPSDADREDVVAPDARVGDALAVLVGDDEAREDRLLHRGVRRAAAGRGGNRRDRVGGEGDVVALRVVAGDGAVEAGENLGFLPGDMKEKVDPYLQPLYDALSDMIPPKKLEEYLESEIIQIAPLAYMRGRTLNDSFVILDEAQNTTRNQLKMFLTRMGISAKFVITGDMSQIDLPRRGDSGLIHAFKILKDIKGIAFVEFNSDDIVRHRLVKDIVKAYNEEQEERQ